MQDCVKNNKIKNATLIADAMCWIYRIVKLLFFLQRTTYTSVIKGKNNHTVSFSLCCPGLVGALH